MGDLSSIAAFHFRTFILEDATWEHLDRHALPTMVPTTKSQLDFLVWWFLWWFTQGSSWRHKKKTKNFPRFVRQKHHLSQARTWASGHGHVRNEKTFWNKAATLQVDQVAIIISNFSCFGELVALVAELRIAPAQSACWRLPSWSIWNHRRCSRCGSPSSTKPSAEPAGGRGIPTKIWVKTGKHQTSPNPKHPEDLFSGTEIISCKIRHRCTFPMDADCQGASERFRSFCTKCRRRCRSRTMFPSCSTNQCQVPGMAILASSSRGIPSPIRNICRVSLNIPLNPLLNQGECATRDRSTARRAV